MNQLSGVSRETRSRDAPMAGFTVDERDLHLSLFPFQRTAVTLALARTRRTVRGHWPWEEPLQMLEWMRLVAAHTGGRCLLLVPLAVAHQFVRDEAPALLDLGGCTTAALRPRPGRCSSLIVTNYDGRCIRPGHVRRRRTRRG